MTMTDPIADMLTRLRNANRAHHDAVSMPYSKLKNAIANILVEEGYIASTTVEDARVGKTLTINLKYGSHREAAIQGLKRVSKPGLRVYAKSTNLPKVRGGLRRGDPVHVLPACSPIARQPRKGCGWGKSSLRTSGDEEAEQCRELVGTPSLSPPASTS